MEETVVDNNNVTQTILDTINSLFQSLFSSIDNNVYGTLDDLAFISTDILNDSLFEKIFGTSSGNGLLLIANSLLVGFAIYYCFKLLYANFTASQIERPYQFIFKLLIVGIVINSSFFLCERIIYINSLVSSSIRGIGEIIFKENISFSSLIQNLNSTIFVDKIGFNLFSFDGLMKGFISISLFNLLFSYSLRYIMLKVFILLTPFALLSLITHSTSWFFRMWIRTLFSLLIMQSFIAIILLLIFSLGNDLTSAFSKLMCIGSMYALIRANSYIQQLIGGISTDISGNFQMMKGLIK